jgi:PAS domain-containing protein
MKSKEKTKKQPVPVKKIINSLKEQIKKLGKLGPRLKNKERELKETKRTLVDRVNTRTSAERVVQRQLRSDIEQHKQLEQVAQDALEYANGIIDTVREPMLVLDADLRIISASRSFYQVFKVKPEYSEKQRLYNIGNRQWDIPKLRELLEDILPNRTSFDNFEVEHDFPGIGRRTMILNARKIYSETNHTQLIPV